MMHGNGVRSRARAAHARSKRGTAQTLVHAQVALGAGDDAVVGSDLVLEADSTPLLRHARAHSLDNSMQSVRVSVCNATDGCDDVAA